MSPRSQLRKGHILVLRWVHYRLYQCTRAGASPSDRGVGGTACLTVFLKASLTFPCDYQLPALQLSSSKPQLRTHKLEEDI